MIIHKNKDNLLIQIITFLGEEKNEKKGEKNHIVLIPSNTRNISSTRSRK